MLDIARKPLPEDSAPGDSPAPRAAAANAPIVDGGDVVAITLTTTFRRGDARDVSRRVREGVGAGYRRFLLDLVEATTVNEGVLVLMLLGLRSELHRRSGRLVVAAECELAERLGTSLRLDDVIGAAPSLDDAIDELLAA
jgi:hypothetical protein